DDDLEAEIDAYDQRRHGIRAIADDRQMHVDKFGVAEFYGWSANVARRLSEPEGREILRPFLEGHGFELE
ncbi:MAG: NADPH-dependent oxidoreductase, partial [Proteobacteria bacterium]|nr:NADPH-dependent oxidoreductase [Pseudomonadota bacterium]